MSGYLTCVYIIGVYLTGVHLMGVYLINEHLTGVHLIGVHLTGMHLTGVHLIGVYPMSVHYWVVPIARRKRCSLPVNMYEVYRGFGAFSEVDTFLGPRHRSQWAFRARVAMPLGLQRPPRPIADVRY